MLNNDILSANLQPDEMALIVEKYPTPRYIKNKLAFAVALKYFQMHAQYPSDRNKASEKLIAFIADQLELTGLNNLHDFDWQGRSARRFKVWIRDFLGLQLPNDKHKNQLVKYLQDSIIPYGHDIQHCVEISYEYFAKQRVEPLQPMVINRLARQAYTKYYDQLFSSIHRSLTKASKQKIDALLEEPDKSKEDGHSNEPLAQKEVRFKHLKKRMAGIKLKNIITEINKLSALREIQLPTSILDNLSQKVLHNLYLRAASETPRQFKKNGTMQTKYALMSILCYYRQKEIIDGLCESLITLIHRVKTTSEKHVDKQIVSGVKKVNGKFNILFKLANISVNHPEGVIEDTIYPSVPLDTLTGLTDELQYSGRWYEDQVRAKMKSSYSKGQRRLILPTLLALTFHPSNIKYQNVIDCLKVMMKQADCQDAYYVVPKDLKHITIASDWVPFVMKGKKIHKINFELYILEQLKPLLKCKSIWVEGAYKYRDPDQDLPNDFYENKDKYFDILNLPKQSSSFVNALKKQLSQSLFELNENIDSNPMVKITDQNGGRIKITPYEAQELPKNLVLLQREISKRWSSTSLLDCLKEVDLNIDFTSLFHSVGTRDAIPMDKLRKRLLLAMYGLGSNIGIKRISSGNHDVEHHELAYVKRKYITEESVRNAAIKVINEILRIRKPEIWGDATTGCACDSTKISAWDQNLMTEWHSRYQGRGVMIYWHTDRRSLCIHSQLKTCSSSEVASMHGTRQKITSM